MHAWTRLSLSIAAVAALALMVPGAALAGQPPGTPGSPPPGQQRQPAPPPSSPAPSPQTSQPSAPQPPASSSSSRQSATGMDALVLSGIHLMNQMKIQAADLAKQKGSTYQVRMLGDRLARDHTMSDAQVIAYANSHGFPLMSEAQIAQRVHDMMTMPMGNQPGVPQPGGAMQQMHQTVQRLQSLNGAAFDRAFTRFAQQSQLSAVRMLTAADQKLPKGSGLRPMINDYIPILEQHYSIASQLQMRNAARAAQGGA